MHQRVLGILLFGLCLSSQLPAQESPAITDHDWIKIDGPQIDQATWLTLNAMAKSWDTSLRDDALDGIALAIRNGTTGPSDPNLVPLLADVCLTPLITIRAPGTEPKTDLPLLRIRAINLASLLGGDDSYNLLIAILNVENEPAVLAQAHAGLRHLMRLPSETEIHLITQHLHDNYPNGPHNALMIELLTDIQAYQERWGTLARQDIFDAVLGLSENSRYLQTVRAQAQALIKLLMGLQ